MTPSDLERVEVPPEPLADALGEFIDQTFPDTSVPVPVCLTIPPSALLRADEVIR